MPFHAFPVAFAEGGAAGGAFFQLVPIVVIFAIFYFLLIAPARKRQKSLQALIDGLKKGDRVVTTGGLYGEVTSVKEKSVFLKVAENVKVRVAKSAVAGLQGQGREGEKK